MNQHYHIEPALVVNPNDDCKGNTLKLVNDISIEFRLEGCNDGRLQFTYSKPNYNRKVEFDIRAYTNSKKVLNEGEEDNPVEAGPYIADMTSSDSQLLGFRVSHIAVHRSKNL